MKKLISILTLTLLLVSCSDQLEFPGVNLRQLVLKQVNYSSLSNPSTCERITYFNDQGRIIEHNLICDGSISPRIYHYTDNNLYLRYTTNDPSSGTVPFAYDQNGLIIGMGAWPNTGNSTVFSYDENIMTSQNYYNGNLSEFYTVYEFEDTTFTKLLSIQKFNTSGVNEEISYRTTFTYQGNNPIEILIERKDFDDVAMVPKSRLTYVYDDKNNPYKSTVSENALVAYLTDIAYDERERNIVFSADNNVVESIGENLESGNISNVSYAYIYTDEMYPQERTMTLNGELFRLEEFEYY
ncbi:MAG: hypothetical protein KJP09_01850 [Bacteroidia bacterium]|nr:hypothetical protein [Bacteroidia bacterium]